MEQDREIEKVNNYRMEQDRERLRKGISNWMEQERERLSKGISNWMEQDRERLRKGITVVTGWNKKERY